MKKIRDNVFWDRTCSHAFTLAEVNASEDYTSFQQNYRIDPELDYPDSWSYSYKKKECIDYAEIDKQLSKLKGMEVVEYLKKIDNCRDKNRFVHAVTSGKKSWFGKFIR